MNLSNKWNLNQVREKWISPVVLVLLLLNLVLGDVKVKICTGTVKGQILKSRDGRPYYSFTGIPYAKPPIGDLRFEAPVPADRWTGTLDATKSMKKCIQKSEINGQEDCLYLNVYTPSTDGNFPVMFWIHGGAFFTGHGGPELYGAEYFMDKNVVMVSINFRLGVLGFLSAEDDVIPGNYGMKDQVMALRWVRENIAGFGGDPEKVTIFGASSGGASVGHHVMSPMSRGLFRKAILQSGTPSCRWSTSLPGVARDRSVAVSDAAGCTRNTSAETLKCLRTLPARFFVDVRERLLKWRTYPTILFPPVVERCEPGREAFLCHHPLFDFRQESFVPIIVGLNSAEGAMFVASLYNDTSLRYPEFYEDFDRLSAILMSYPYFTSDSNGIGKTIFAKYFSSGKIEDHSHLDAVKMFTDCYLHGIIEMALRLTSPVYFYLYDYQNEFSFNTLFGDCKKPLGITHGDELTSLFKLDSINPKELNEMDTKVSKLMVDIWSNFAASKTEPTIDGTENGQAWPTFTLRKQTILHINTDRPNVMPNPYEENYAFWNNLPLFSHMNKMISNSVSTSEHKKFEL